MCIHIRVALSLYAVTFPLSIRNIFQIDRSIFLPYDRMRPTQRYHVLREVPVVFIFTLPVPVEPGNLIVLTVCIIVSVLRVQEFVPGEEHGSAAAHEQDCHCIFRKLSPEEHNPRIIRFALLAAVPASVVVGAVGVVPAIFVIVLSTVCIHVPQGESVVAVQEVDRSLVPARCGVIYVRRAGDTIRCRLKKRQISLEEIPHIISIFSVPFGPPVPCGKCSYLIQPSGVPGFGDEFDICKNRIKCQILQKRRIIHRRPVLISSENARKVEAESVYVICHGPVAERVEDHLLHDRMVAVQGVSAAAEIVVFSIRRKNVVDIVVKTFE